MNEKGINLGVYVIKSKSSDEVIRCPKCTNDMLRAWKSEKGTIALCYECGTLFECDTGNILSQFDGSLGI